jgi:hypothetical protein
MTSKTPGIPGCELRKNARLKRAFLVLLAETEGFIVKTQKVLFNSHILA